MAEAPPCPLGCGYPTDDPFGGPCSPCWYVGVLDSSAAEQLALETWRPRIAVETITPDPSLL